VGWGGGLSFGLGCRALSLKFDVSSFECVAICLLIPTQSTGPNRNQPQPTATRAHLQGSANVCPNNLAGADPDSAVSVLVHELLHALGFTDDSFDKFIDASGAPVPKDQVVKEVTDPYGR